VRGRLALTEVPVFQSFRMSVIYSKTTRAGSVCPYVLARQCCRMSDSLPYQVQPRGACEGAAVLPSLTQE
jgi:hypothetical protein